LDDIRVVDLRRIYKAEGFNSWAEFLAVMRTINKIKKIPADMHFYTHFYTVLELPACLPK